MADYKNSNQGGGIVGENDTNSIDFVVHDENSNSHDGNGNQTTNNDNTVLARKFANTNDAPEDDDAAAIMIEDQGNSNLVINENAKAASEESEPVFVPVEEGNNNNNNQNTINVAVPLASSSADRGSSIQFVDVASSTQFRVEEEEQQQQPPTIVSPAHGGGGAIQTPPASHVSIQCHAAVDSPAAMDGGSGDAYPQYPPPRCLSKRAAALALTPRGGRAPPTTPRSRSTNVSMHPSHNVTTADPHAPPMPELAPGQVIAVPPISESDDEVAQGSSQHKRESSAHDKDSAFSSEAEEPHADESAAPRPTAPPLPGGDLGDVLVSSHARELPGDQWQTVVTYSKDAVERAVVADTTEALHIDGQFLRVAELRAVNGDGEGGDGGGGSLHVVINVLHDATMTEDEINKRLQAWPFEHTTTLHDLRTARGGPAYGLAAALQGMEAPKADNNGEEKKAISNAEEPTTTTTTTTMVAPLEEKSDPTSFSFTQRVGDGMLLIDFYRHGEEGAEGEKQALELYFNAEASDIRVGFVKKCVGEHLHIPVSQLAIVFNGAELSDEETGAQHAWIYGSMMDAVHHPEREEAEHKAQEATAVPGDADAHAVSAEPKLVDTRKGAAPTTNTKKTPRYMRPTEGGQNNKKKPSQKSQPRSKPITGAEQPRFMRPTAATTPRPAAKEEDARKSAAAAATTKNKKTTKRRASSAPHGKRSARKHKDKSSPVEPLSVAAVGGGGGRRRRSYSRPTESNTQKHVSVAAHLPDHFTAPQAFTPRSPRRGLEHRPDLAMQYEPLPKGTPRTPRRRSLSLPATPRRIGNTNNNSSINYNYNINNNNNNYAYRRPSGLPPVSLFSLADQQQQHYHHHHHVAELDALWPVPPQHVVRAVRPTTPRPGATATAAAAVNGGGGYYVKDMRCLRSYPSDEDEAGDDSDYSEWDPAPAPVPCVGY